MSKVSINYELCQGHARCAFVAPEVFTFFDGDEKPRIDDDAVSRTDVGLLVRAKKACPERAIVVLTQES